MTIMVKPKPNTGILIKRKGGAGSGNYGHAGRPGMVGGSAKPGGAFSPGGIVTGAGIDGNEKARALLEADLGETDYGFPVVYSAVRERQKADIKNETVTTLANDVGVPYDSVNGMLAQWAATSNDNDYGALSMQEDAAAEFGLQLSAWQQKNLEAAMAKPGHGDDRILPPDQQRAVLRQMYDNTQQAFEAMGLKPDDTVRLFRGVHLPPDDVAGWALGDVVDWHGSTMESWSVSRDIAAHFGSTRTSADPGMSRAGVVVEMDVPIRNIIGTAVTGFGCITEGEYVVFGSVPGNRARVARIAGFDKDGFPEWAPKWYEHTGKEMKIRVKGGAGSGNWGHAGRPGLRGGSSPRKGIGAAMSLRTGPTAEQRQAEAKKLTVDVGQLFSVNTKFTVFQIFRDAGIISKDAWQTSGEAAVDGIKISEEAYQGIDEWHQGRISYGELTQLMLGTKPGEFPKKPAPTPESVRPGEYRAGTAPGEEMTLQLAFGGYQDRRGKEFMDRGIKGSWMGSTYKERGQVKDAIVTELSNATGLHYNTVNAAIGQWAETSNDTSLRSLSLQEAAAEELGTSLSKWQQGKLDSVQTSGLWSTRLMDRPNERAFIREMYAHTQRELAAAGFKPGDTITLFRGMKSRRGGWNAGETASYHGNAIESWSLSAATANIFGDNILAMKVPVENVVGTARTGFGCLMAGEFVIMGNIPGQIVRVLKTS